MSLARGLILRFLERFSCVEIPGIRILPTAALGHSIECSQPRFSDGTAVLGWHVHRFRDALFMRARTSIKVTLPAVLSSAESERIKDLLRSEGLLQQDESGRIKDPYSLSPPVKIYGLSENVRNGTGAMRAYQEMLYGDISSDQAARREYEKALLRYCWTDTPAMVVIWEHWLYLRDATKSAS
jgi:hypothetical protein